jgi:protein-tyrosine phosphatase
MLWPVQLLKARQGSLYLAPRHQYAWWGAFRDRLAFPWHDYCGIFCRGSDSGTAQQRQARTRGKLENLVDLHSHILPGWYGEEPTLQQALEIVRAAAEHGVSAIVLTPNVRTAEDAHDRAVAIPLVVRWFQEEIDSLQIPLTVFPGAELEPGPHVISALKRLAPITLAATGRYVLLEAAGNRFSSLAELAKRLSATGFHVVLGNPERAQEVQDKPAIISDLVNAGALVQIAAASLAAPGNAREWSSASMLLVMGMVHFISTAGYPSDTHYGHLAEAVRIAAQIVGKEQALRLVTENPRKVLQGEPLEGDLIQAAQAAS